MMNCHAAAVALAAALAAGCAGQSTLLPPAPADDRSWVGDARAIANAVPPKLLAVLRDEIAQGGPEGAIGACREQAPAMARQASEESGWVVRRVSLKNRNPKAVPDAWERSVLEDFEARAAAGTPPAALERAEVVNGVDGMKELRYMRALPVAELCTGCHGTPDKLSPAVVEKLKTLYPDDRAVGYKVGDIRGAMTLKKVAP